MAKKVKPKKPEHDPLHAETVEGMKVEKIGRGHYRCASESQPGVVYDVDVLANEGLGECDCWHFKTRCWKRWSGSGKLYDSFRCKHLRRVRNFVLDAIFAPYVKMEKGI